MLTKKQPLRLIIMSATLRLTDFLSNTNLFPTKPEVINVAARQFPVTVHFSRKTQSDYLEEAYKKVSKIHARLPPGGILIFLTGQNEIQTMCKRLNKRWGPKAVQERKEAKKNMFRLPRQKLTTLLDDEPLDKPASVQSSALRDLEVEEMQLGSEEQHDLAADVDDGIAIDGTEQAEDDLDTSDEEDNLEFGGLSLDQEDSDGQSKACRWILAESSPEPLHILPLYSLLPTDKQMRVFDAVPEGSRLVVVSTNVAETSLTIPGIRYVVDAGRAKEVSSNNLRWEFAKV